MLKRLLSLLAMLLLIWQLYQWASQKFAGRRERPAGHGKQAAEDGCDQGLLYRIVYILKRA